MSNLVKLILALVLAAVAAIVNVAYLASKESPAYYLAVSDDTSPIQAGDYFPAADADGSYKAIPIPGDVSKLGSTLIPFDKRAIVFGMKARRKFVGGDPIFFADVVEDTPRYDELGPFTLLSVGEAFTGVAQPGEASAAGSAITVEPTYDTDENGVAIYKEATRRLLQIVEARRNSRDAPAHLRIVAIVARPLSGDHGAASLQSLTAPAPSSDALIRTKERAIIVPLQDVSIISNVLRIGTEVAFIVPAYP